MLGHGPISGRSISEVRPLAPSAAAPVNQIATVRASANRRHDRDRKLLQAPVHPTTVTIEAGADTTLADPFQTRVGRSRRSLAMGWMAALTAQPSVSVIPYSAYFAPQRKQRRETHRRLFHVEQLHWPYIAPTVAAILKPERAKVIEFRTRLQLTPKHDLFPPATGPPEFSFAAVAGARSRYRKGRQGLFLSAGDILSVPTPSNTPAVYPSYLARELPAFKFVVRHLREPFQPDYPQTQVTTSDDRTLADPFVTRVQKRRKRPVVADVIGVNAATPVIPPETAWKLAQARKTEFTATLQRLPLHLVFPATPPVPEQPLSAWRLVSVFQSSQRRTLLPQAPLLEYPQTPYVPPPQETQTPAGRRKRKRYEIEIDGQIFPVESAQEAQDLLDRAKQLAATQAANVAETVVSKRLKSKAPEGKPIRVPVPQIRTPDNELASIVIRARHAIAKIYREQALAAEIRLRMELMQREQDDDSDDEFLLLL